jgi:hypothetical protein
MWVNFGFTNGDILDQGGGGSGSGGASSASELTVSAYTKSGTYALAATDLQTNLQTLVDHDYQTDAILETHMVEQSAHLSKNLDVVFVTGTLLGTDFPQFITSGTTDLQNFLGLLDLKINSITSGTVGPIGPSGTNDPFNIIVSSYTSGSYSLVSGTLQSNLQSLINYDYQLDANLRSHLANPTGAHSGTAISIIADSLIGLTGTDAQSAISGSYQVSYNHINNPSGAHAASAISFISGTSGINASDVQAAITQVKTIYTSGTSRLETVLGITTGDLTMSISGTYLSGTSISTDLLELDSALNAHVIKTSGSHAASSISFISGTSTISATDAQDALNAIGIRLAATETTSSALKFYTVMGGCGAVAPTANQVIGFFVFERAVTLKATATLDTMAYGNALTVATASTTCPFKKLTQANVLTSITGGQMVFASSAFAPSFANTSDVSFAAGDALIVYAPATPDATLANFSFTISLVLS